MFRRDFLMSLLATPMIRRFRGWSGLGADATNAADHYHEAFDWVQRLAGADAALLRQTATLALDAPGVDRLIDGAGPALRALRVAATAPTCRWKDEIGSLDELGRGHLDVTNEGVIRVACLSARRLALRGRNREALDDLFAALTLAHRIGTGGFLFARVLECSHEVKVFRTLGLLLPGWDRATLDDLEHRLDAFPPPESAAPTIEHEARFILGSIRSKLATVGPVLGDDNWSDLDLGADLDPALRRITGGDPARLLDHLAASAPAYSELCRCLDLPRPDCWAAVDEFEQSYAETFPIAASAVEAARGVRHVIDRMRALRAMVRAGLVLIRDGKPAFQAIRDPFGTAGFTLEPHSDGWLIRSALRDDGRPEVTLNVGGA